MTPIGNTDLVLAPELLGKVAEKVNDLLTAGQKEGLKKARSEAAGTGKLLKQE